MKPRWIAFTERWPDQVAALDDQNIRVTPKVLVTNNLKARNRMGEMSHVWLASPFKSSAPEKTGDVVAFDEGDRTLHCLTHWLEMEGLHQLANNTET
ncbi:hypothetical protein [Pseudomonas chlororaphis]|uniref:hypothetical protein n=1 Tax=Pseudomonas chlororaphis TaxID=587753 RepID=UPI0011799D02|nr:hypothetical protein [Pseudomonas chlororaphis]